MNICCFSHVVAETISQALACLVGPSGLEPPTSCLSGTRSNLLSYEPMWLVWLAHLGVSGFGNGFTRSLYLCQHWAIFPGGFPPSIVATAELNFCVRNGNRWTLCVCNTDYSWRLIQPSIKDLDPWKLNNIRFAETFVSLWPSSIVINVLSWTTRCHLSIHRTFSIERRWSSRTFRYGYLVTT